MLHSKKDIFIDEENRNINIYEKKSYEEEADDFASRTLIPRDTYSEFIEKSDFSKHSIINFAKTIEVSPCIVVGRLQHDGFVKYSEFSELRPRLNLE